MRLPRVTNFFDFDFPSDATSFDARHLIRCPAVILYDISYFRGLTRDHPVSALCRLAVVTAVATVPIPDGGGGTSRTDHRIASSHITFSLQRCLARPLPQCFRPLPSPYASSLNPAAREQVFVSTGSYRMSSQAALELYRGSAYVSCRASPCMRRRLTYIVMSVTDWDTPSRMRWTR